MFPGPSPSLALVLGRTLEEVLNPVLQTYRLWRPEMSFISAQGYTRTCDLCFLPKFLGVESLYSFKGNICVEVLKSINVFRVNSYTTSIRGRGKIVAATNHSCVRLVHAITLC